MTHVNRRQAIQAVSAGLGAAALGRGSETKVRTGILCIQHSHLNGKLEAMYGNPDYEVVSICEPDPAARKEHGSKPLFQRLRWGSMDEMLGDKSLDLIVFEGKVQDAIPYGNRGLDAGKHLHLEN